MAIENKPREEFDIVFGQNESLELSTHHDYDTSQPWIFKIIVIGDSNVGKTCLTYRFCGGTFLKNPEATIGVDFRERTVELDGQSIKVGVTAFTQNSHFNLWFISLIHRSVAILFRHVNITLNVLLVYLKTSCGVRKQLYKVQKK